MGAAVLVIWLAPQAQGSGIPECKAYSNGAIQEYLFHPKTLIAKLGGITCAVAGNFVVGKEGPMVCLLQFCMCVNSLCVFVCVCVALFAVLWALTCTMCALSVYVCV